MFKYVLVLALSATAAACATTQPTAAEVDCVTQPEEATGSRVESTTVCPPPAD